MIIYLTTLVWVIGRNVSFASCISIHLWFMKYFIASYSCSNTTLNIYITLFITKLWYRYAEMRMMEGIDLLEASNDPLIASLHINLGNLYYKLEQYVKPIGFATI